MRNYKIKHSKRNRKDGGNMNRYGKRKDGARL